MRVGLDIGSTTLKCVVLDKDNKIVYTHYERHLSQIAAKTAALIDRIRERFPEEKECPVCISGSAGMGLAEDLGVSFVQEVYASRLAVKALYPDTDVVIELGGEDAKILFLTGALEVRMNGSCAGGTGAFIDQMATLLGVTADEMNTLAAGSDKLYTIASRCGVFAKSDIQALLNQGALPQDIAHSIFHAVVSQTIAGLAQGREIGGKVLYLGGPMTFFSGLRAAFDDALKLQGTCPENSLYFVAYGAARYPESHAMDLAFLAEAALAYQAKNDYKKCKALFASESEYEDFKQRHRQKDVSTDAQPGADHKLWLGVDAGSTTVKFVAINRKNEIVFTRYVSNKDNPVSLVRGFLAELYERYPNVTIGGAAATGYGEDIIKNAFSFDLGVVETIAHFTAAYAFDPEVDFIIDIGGQDIKCFKIRNGAIDNIFLNEACSSGCGSFLQSFAATLGYNSADFAALGLFSDAPVDLGSRCTVFMNSSVKQAQKDGATLASISSGLSISVVKNALYKVIRAATPDSLGKHIVVQGGTFMSDAVLRSFELEIGREVTRPNIAGLMGAYGAALYVKNMAYENSAVLTPEKLAEFSHTVTRTGCKGCANYCQLTVNRFGTGRRYISGNRCELPLTGKSPQKRLNIYDYKKELLAAYQPVAGRRGRIGMPLALNVYEMLPFWHTFFTALGFELHTTTEADRKLYIRGQHTIPSDTVCYPAKLVHGHMEALLDQNLDAIFYPCLSYNFDEGISDNCYNCPVVAYYPEVIQKNVKRLAGTTFIGDYIGIHRPKDFPKKMREILAKYFPAIPLREIQAAAQKAYAENEAYRQRIWEKGQEMMAQAKEQGLSIIVLAGRPYHMDREINHGIDDLICDCGAAVVSEDCVAVKTGKASTLVVNQWTYHARMYAAAQYIAQSRDSDINLVQLVSFGCGVDAITTDEIREILEDSGRIYTQLKIDEIANLGAVKIRMRSLFAAIEQKKREEKQ